MEFTGICAGNSPGTCAGNSPGTGEFPAQIASNAENVSIWWRHHKLLIRHFKNGSTNICAKVYPISMYIICALLWFGIDPFNPYSQDYITVIGYQDPFYWHDLTYPSMDK